MAEHGRRAPDLTAGRDLGDRYSHLCVVDEAGEVVEESGLRTTEAGLRRRFEGTARLRMVVEVGTHSPWVSRLLEEPGHEVWLANPRELRLIYRSDRKSDRVDAEYLAWVGRQEPKLLAPVAYRGEAAQADLAVIRSREVSSDTPFYDLSGRVLLRPCGCGVIGHLRGSGWRTSAHFTGRSR